MKKVLLGTTALVAAGAFAGIGAAQAQDMMVGMQPLELGGYYTIAGISSDVDGVDNSRGHGIQQNIELEGRATAELDNGITAGIRVRISGNTHAGHFSSHEHGATGMPVDTNADLADIQAGDVDEHTHQGAGGAASGDDANIDETEVFFTGSFGGLHIGMIEAASQQMTVWAPGGTVPIGGIKSPWFGGIGGMWTSGNFMDEDSTKIVYFSPSFNGISIGVSYAPENTTNNYGGMADDEDQQGEQVTAAISYSGDFMGGSFSANVGHEGHSTEADGDMACMGDGCDPSGMRYGLSVSIDDIAVGAAIYEQDGTGAERMDGMGNHDRKMLDVGIAWTQGPLMLGLQYGSNDGGGGSEADSTSLNVNYNLGGGVDLGAVYATGENAMGADYTNVLLGTMFNF